ncbi:MAG: arsenate reductase (glutaredoxin) [Bacteroidia bacterium]|nr:MAG: arsenate reductase (glutaredoxin) [Bacteroidia bacterium]
MKIYHNPRCSKSRKGLEYLKEKNIEVEIIQYLKDIPFTIETLTELVKKSGKEAHDMVRTHEELYKKEYKGKEFTEEEWIKIMVENPRLIKRPLIETKDTVIWGGLTENIDKIL